MGTLRFILAISVITVHAAAILGLNFVGGELAVKAFYIISGFYMALILNEKYIGVNNSYKLFISNRLLRLYPIYWTVLLLTILYSLYWIVVKGQQEGSLAAFIQYAHNMSFGSFFFLIFTNIFLFLQDMVMFMGLNTTTGHLFFISNFRLTNPGLYGFLFIPQAWTIGLEISFYLIAPFIATKKIKLILFLALISFAIRFILYKNGLNGDPWSYRFFPSELIFFLLGIIAYHILQKIKTKEIKKTYLYMIWIGIILYTILFPYINIPERNYVYLFTFFLCLPFVFILSKKWRLDRNIGELSYPIYISHVFVISCVKAWNIPLIGGIGFTVAVISVIFSIILNKLISNRIERYRQRRVIALAKIQ